MDFAFTVEARDGAARAGRMATAHGPVATPAFMPVGTAGTVKAMSPATVAETGADMVLCNTYHLMLRPGADRIERLGGLQRFMAWPGPILTDSGGFQVMSLAKLRTLTEQGVAFQSHIDGRSLMLTPESSVEVQRKLGATVTMALDECTAYPVSEDAARDSMELSMRWAERSRKAYVPREGHALFGIVQGSVFAELRKRSAGALAGIGFDGYAIGGLAVGEEAGVMIETAALTAALLPEAGPRYLMGVGRPEDMVAAVAAGVDMFDCVLPTRSGRNGQAFTSGGAVNLRNARHADDPRPLDAACRCPTCRGFSRAYLHHLVRAREILASMLLTRHNLHFYQALMSGLRTAICDRSLDAFRKRFDAARARGDIEPL